MTTRRRLIYTATFWIYQRLLRLNLSRKKKGVQSRVQGGDDGNTSWFTRISWVWRETKNYKKIWTKKCHHPSKKQKERRPISDSRRWEEPTWCSCRALVCHNLDLATFHVCSSNWVNNEGGSTSSVFFFPFATLSALHQQFFFFNCVSLYFRPSRGQSRVLISWNLYQQHRGRVFFASPTHSPRLVEREKEKWSNTYRRRFKKKRQTHQLLHKVVKLV
jgi:hypothetical protein